ncbi:tyrosine-type recombinase/integrase [Chondromyces apiculatus]|uniref:Phage integrase n=1 Tax=Chondromyces apiculatus DSM 436 TaxID=1192034 RepID=A0A017TES9_9BACT|nr:tyrosine-type recombinase/integrase [Chondromyces apiculatus]EYF07071.1 Phage integrase [Chondromyces apiculatus DSM 436]
MPWGRLRAVHTGPVPALLAERYTPATANRYLAALRGVLAQARRHGQMTYEEYEDATDFKPVRGERSKPGRKLTGEELRRMFASARGDVRRRRGARDAAVLALLSGGGLRRAEVAGLELGGFDGVAVQVLGKGNKQRLVPLPDGALRAVEDWLAVRGRHPGPLVTHLRNQRRGLCAETINDVVQGLAERAGVRKLTSHDGRRTYITDLLLAGAPVRDVQALVGHASLEQTEKYLRDNQREQAKARTVKLLAVPY